MQKKGINDFTCKCTIMATTTSYKPSWLKGGEVDMKTLKKEAESYCKLINSDVSTKQKEGANKLYDLVSFAWSLETRLARDAADFVCDLIRNSNALDKMLKKCASISNSQDTTPEQKGLQLDLLSTIEQIMIADNREYISQHQLFPSLLVLASSTDTLSHVRCGLGIFENLFKVSPSVSLKLIQSGGLDAIMRGCRYTDDVILHHCAAAMANCALYGSPKVHRAMMSKHADHWLFPLAFSQDSAVKYYALIAICILVSDSELQSLVSRSGTLELVIPFLQVQDPLQFPRTCPNHAHGRASSWLERLIPLLECPSEEAQSLAAFHFAMEAGIKQKQNRLKVRMSSLFMN